MRTPQVIVYEDRRQRGDRGRSDDRKHDRRNRRRHRDLPPSVSTMGRTVEQIIAEQEARRRGRTLYRLRWHLLPHWVVLCLLAAAAIGWLADALIAWRTETRYGGPIALVVGALVMAALGIVWATGRTQFRRWRWHRRVSLAALFAGAWLTTVIWTGPSWESLATLFAADVTLGAGYWRTIRIRAPHHKPLPGDERRFEQDLTTHGSWSAHIGCDGGIAPRSRLTGREVDDKTERYTVELVPGKQSINTILSNLDKVHTGLRRPAEEVIVEPHPSRDPARLLLTIVNKSPIKQTVPFVRPQYVRDGEHSWIEPGWYADGTSRVRVPVYAPNSIRNLVIIGGQGSGKSALLNALAVSLKASEHTVVFYLDGQDGVSSPELLTHADWAPTGPDRELEMLEALERIYAVRGKIMKRQRVPGLTPSADLPGIVVNVDECHVFWRPESKYLARWERLVRTGRKVAVGFWAASQHPAVESFGNDKIRSLLQQYTTLVLRIAGAVARNILRLDVDPASLPTMPGYGYVIGGTQDEGVRSAPFRADHLDDKEGTADAWFERYPGCEPLVGPVLCRPRQCGPAYRLMDNPNPRSAGSQRAVAPVGVARVSGGGNVRRRALVAVLSGRASAASAGGVPLRDSWKGRANVSERDDWNKQVIAEFRANEGRVGGRFEHAPMILIHHIGARTGTERVTPLVYFLDGERMIIVASKGGSPTNPDWYHNLKANPVIEVEVGTETFTVKVTEIAGAERTAHWARVVERMPGFGDYQRNTSRQIPLLALTRTN